MRLSKTVINSILVVLTLTAIGLFHVYQNVSKTEPLKPAESVQNKYWFLLNRSNNTEVLYSGLPGNVSQSRVIKTFTVKTGVPGERPTPLPKLLGRDYWIITDKVAQPDDPETAPYFLTLDIPAPENAPYGPVPYNECGGQQCDWIVPGAFGLHGTAGNPEKLSISDPGSSGCIRHSDEDITYLYNLLDPSKYEIRYYIEE